MERKNQNSLFSDSLFSERSPFKRLKEGQSTNGTNMLQTKSWQKMLELALKDAIAQGMSNTEIRQTLETLCCEENLPYRISKTISTPPDAVDLAQSSLVLREEKDESALSAYTPIVEGLGFVEEILYVSEV